MSRFKYLLLGFLFLPAITLAAPTTNYFLNIAPTITDTYTNGTASLEWLNGYFKYASTTVTSATTLCLSTDCRSVWPTGSTFGTTSISATAPLNWNTTTAVLSITQAGTGANGYLSSTDFNTFNNKISSTSLSGTGGTTYNSTTGVISSFSYPFPSNATTTALTLGGLTLSNLAGGGTLCVHVNNSGTLSTTASDCGSSGGTVTSVTASNPLFSSGGTTPNISTIFSTTTTFGLGNNGFLVTGATGIPFTAASSTLNLPNAALQNSSITVNGTTFNLGDSKTITAASSTLLANSNTFSGTNTFSNSPIFSTLTAGTVNSTAGGTLYNTTTSTPTVSAPITYSGTLGQFISGVSGTFGCASCVTQGTASSTITGTTGQVVYMQGTNSPIGTSSIFIATNGTVGISTTTPSVNSQLAVAGNILVTNSGTGYSLLGTYPAVVGAGNPSVAQDNLVIGTSTTGSNNVRGALLGSSYMGGTATGVSRALNAFSSAAATTNLTVTATGGAINNRYAAINDASGYNVAMMSGVSSFIGVQGTLASTTDATDFNAEAPTMTSGNVLTNFREFWGRATAVLGTLTSQAGLDIENLTAATNNTEVLLGTATIPTGNFGVYQSDTNNNYFAGNVGVGITAPDGNLTVSLSTSTVPSLGALIASIHIVSPESLSGSRIVYDGINNTPTITARRQNGSEAAPLGLNSGDQIFNFNVMGYDATGGMTTSQRGFFGYFADGAWTGGSDPTRVVFATAPASGGTGVERMRIDSNGNMGIGSTTPWGTLSVMSTTDPVFVVATSSGATIGGYDADGHSFTSGPAPAVSTCGTGTGTVVGDDQNGTITTATAATACTLTFSKAYKQTPTCTVTDNSLVGFADISAISTSAVTFGISSALTGGLLFYNCKYHRT